MKKYGLLFLLAACGDGGSNEQAVETQTVYVTNTVEVEKASPKIVCQVFEGQASLPSTHQVKGSHVVEMEELNFDEVASDLEPFAGFIDTEAEHITKNFAMRCNIRFEVTQAGNHIFKLTSDDGSELYINGVRIINNGGSHAMLMKQATISLPLGVHDLRVHYFEGSGPKGLNLSVQRPNIIPSPEEL